LESIRKTHILKNLTWKKFKIESVVSSVDIHRRAVARRRASDRRRPDLERFFRTASANDDDERGDRRRGDARRRAETTDEL